MAKPTQSRCSLRHHITTTEMSNLIVISVSNIAEFFSYSVHYNIADEKVYWLTQSDYPYHHKTCTKPQSFKAAHFTTPSKKN